MEPFLEKASERFAGSGFISYDVFSDHPWSFTQVGNQVLAAISSNSHSPSNMKTVD